MPPLTGFLATLPQDTILEAGVLYINSDSPFGVSRGGLAFDPGTEWENLDFDDKVYPITGLDRKTGGMAKISGTIIELSDARMPSIEPGEVRSGAAADYTYAPNGASDFIADGVYLTNVRVAYRRGNGGFVIVRFPLALLTKYQVKGVSKGAAEIAIEIEARTDGLLPGTPSYEIHVATTTQVGPPTNPTQLMNAYNARGGDTTGGTMLALYVQGVNQTIVPNGDASLPSPGTNSPTGFWCTKWDDAVHPNQGKHFRPSADRNGGNGAPCDAAGLIQGMGLELIDGTGYTGGALFHGDPGLKTDPSIAASGNLKPILADYSSGITWGGVAKFVTGVAHVLAGEDADANKVEIGYGDDFGNVVGYRNSLFWDDGAFGGANWPDHPATGGTPYLHFACSINHVAEPEAAGTWENWRIQQHGRDIFNFYFGNANQMAGGRRLRLGSTYGATTNNATRSVKVFYVLKGHSNAAQNSLLCDYFDTYHGTYNDVRRLGYLFGDSEFTAKVNLADQQAIQNGADGAPAIANFGYMPNAYSGMRPQLMIHPFSFYLRAADFSKRPNAGVAIMFSEWINATPGNETLADTLAQNYFLADIYKAIGPTKVRVSLHNMAFASNFNNQQTLNDPAIRNDLAANYATHAAALIDFITNTALWNANAQIYTPTGDPNRSNSVWDGIHPFHLTSTLWRSRIRAAFRAAMGEDISNVTMEVLSSIPVVNLTAGAPTATPAWTCKNNAGAVLGGKVLAFSSWKHIPAQSHDDEALDNTICTVHPTTGLITRVAAGVALVLATADDGGRGLCVVVCT